MILLFIANLFVAIGEPAGTQGNIRLLQFLSPADLAVGAIMIVAIVLVGMAPTAPAATGLTPDLVRLTAGAVVAFVAVAAFIRAITVLTISHQHAAVKVGNLFDALAAVLVAGVATYWAFRTT